MNYPEYRRQGLPITSCHVESTIKRINRRMKGTEKFWDEGAEPLLCLVADHLSPPDQRDHYYAWNELPQPQVFTALGFSNVKPRFSSPS